MTRLQCEVLHMFGAIMAGSKVSKYNCTKLLTVYLEIFTDFAVDKAYHEI